MYDSNYNAFEINSFKSENISIIQSQYANECIASMTDYTLSI